MAAHLYYNAQIVNEGTVTPGWLFTEGRMIAGVGPTDPVTVELLRRSPGVVAHDCQGRYIVPGVIDTHVHFRDPGLTEKADMATESAAAKAGGVTSFVDMPNTKPDTVSRAELRHKMEIAAEKSVINYGFFIGATNDNLPELLLTDFTEAAGIKLFLGSSTGNMLVDSDSTLSQLFAQAPALIAVHAEDEAIINAAKARLQAEYPDGIPVELHPEVRPREACIAATRHAIALAEATGARLHVCHISTADELRLIADAKARGVKVTAETCPQYLLFDRNDFERLGARIKCNPAIKDPSDRIALIRELRPGGVIDSIATDHAPHLLAQKQGNALTAASGMPMIQFSLPAVLDLVDTDPEAEGLGLGIAQVVELMCHAPARIFGIDRRGFLKVDHYADFAILEPVPLPGLKVTDEAVVSRCGWTPLAGRSLSWRVVSTVVNGGEGPMPLKFSASSPQC